MSYLLGAFVGSLAITFILAAIANKFLKRPLLAGLIAGLLASSIAYGLAGVRDPTMHVFYWVGAALSGLILRSRAKKAEAAT